MVVDSVKRVRTTMSKCKEGGQYREELVRKAGTETGSDENSEAVRRL